MSFCLDTYLQQSDNYEIHAARAIGFDHKKGTVFLPYTKPCHGTSVVELPIDEEEIEKIRKLDTGNKK